MNGTCQAESAKMLPTTKDARDKLDSFIRGKVSDLTKSSDQELARMQSLVLDPLVPLSYLQEVHISLQSWDEA